MVKPIEAVDTKKIRKMTMSAEDYISKTEELTLQPRFDVAEVTVKNDGSFHLNYIKNAF